MVDLEKIKYRVAEVKENLHKIKKYSSLDDKEFWSDERNIFSVKHLLLVSIEACGNVCVHISAKRLYKAASSFAECFENFHKEGIIEEDLSAKLRSMARFRNILVHRYWETDDKKILDYARNNLGDFEQFLKAIVKYLGIQP